MICITRIATHLRERVTLLMLSTDAPHTDSIVKHHRGSIPGLDTNTFDINLTYNATSCAYFLLSVNKI